MSHDCSLSDPNIIPRPKREFHTPFAYLSSCVIPTRSRARKLKNRRSPFSPRRFNFRSLAARRVDDVTIFIKRDRNETKRVEILISPRTPPRAVVLCVRARRISPSRYIQQPHSHVVRAALNEKNSCRTDGGPLCQQNATNFARRHVSRE